MLEIWDSLFFSSYMIFLKKLFTFISTCAVCLRLTYFSAKWKTANVIVIPKWGKNSSRVEIFRSISLLSTTPKLSEWLVQRRIRDQKYWTCWYPNSSAFVKCTFQLISWRDTVSYTHLDVYKRQPHNYHGWLGEILLHLKPRLLMKNVSSAIPECPSGQFLCVLTCLLYTSRCV